MPAKGKVAKHSMTVGVLRSGKVCSIRIARAPKRLASRCGPTGGAIGLDRKMCSDGDVVTTTMTTRRYKRTIRRTQTCTPLALHDGLMPIISFTSR